MKNITILTLNQSGINDFAAARNQLLKTVRTKWVLFLDSDEILTKELEGEIEHAISSGHYDAYYLKRQDTFLGRVLKHGETGHAAFVRLARVGWGVWERPVHEVWHGKSPVGFLVNPILHHPHQSLASFLYKIDLYSTIESSYRYSQGKRAKLRHLFFYPIGKFIYNYLFRLGILDGVPGLIHALFMSFHSYLTWSKLYLLCKRS